MLLDLIHLTWLQLLNGNRQSVTEMDRFARRLQNFETIKRLEHTRESTSTCMRVVAVMITPTRSTMKTEHPSFAFDRRSWREWEEKGMKATSFNTTHDSGSTLHERRQQRPLDINRSMLREENGCVERQALEDAPDGGTFRVARMKRDDEAHSEACHRRRSDDDESVKSIDLNSAGYASPGAEAKTEANGGNVDNGEKQKPRESERRLEKKCLQTISFWNNR